MSRRRIFVFGSNLKGIHGAGAAAYARTLGAEIGVGEGLTGETYALPTCSVPGRPLSAPEMRAAVGRFVTFARARSDMDFLVTAVGCGIACFDPQQVAVEFRGAPDNVYLQARLAEGFGP